MNRKIVRPPRMISHKKEKIDHEHTDGINRNKNGKKRRKVYVHLTCGEGTEREKYLRSIRGLEEQKGKEDEQRK